jgi:hypothetical protein
LRRQLSTCSRLDDRGLQDGISLWTMFKQDLELFRRKDRADISTRL